MRATSKTMRGTQLAFITTPMVISTMVSGRMIGVWAEEGFSWHRVARLQANLMVIWLRVVLSLKTKTLTWCRQKPKTPTSPAQAAPKSKQRTKASQLSKKATSKMVVSIISEWSTTRTVTSIVANSWTAAPVAGVLWSTTTLSLAPWVPNTKRLPMKALGRLVNAKTMAL